MYLQNICIHCYLILPFTYFISLFVEIYFKWYLMILNFLNSLTHILACRLMEDKEKYQLAAKDSLKQLLDQKMDAENKLEVNRGSLKQLLDQKIKS